jgi:hypothetical protein
VVKISFKKTSLILLMIAVVLLGANVLIDKLLKKEERPISVSLNKNEIDKLFLSTLNSFGISDSLIKEVKIKFKKRDSITFKYLITVPGDLAMTDLLLDLQNSCKEKNIQIKSSENGVKGNILIELSTQNILKIAAELKVDKNIYRKCGSLSVVLFGLEDLSDDEKKILLTYPEVITFALIPSKENKEFLNNILLNKKHFTVILGNNIEDLDFKLSDNYSKERNKISIRTIIGSFPTKCFIIDNENALEPATFNFIKSEFEKRKLMLIEKSSLRGFDKVEDENLLKSFNSIISELNFTNNLIVTLDYRTFLIVEKDLKMLFKKGVKLVQMEELKPNTF